MMYGFESESPYGMQKTWSSTKKFIDIQIGIWL